MHPPIFVREPSAAERGRLEAALRAPDALTVRRAQVVLASAEGRRPRVIARELRCAVQTVRNGIRAFDAAGLRALGGRLVAAEERRAGAGRGGTGTTARDPAPAAARLRPRAEHLDPRPPGARSARAGAEPGGAAGGDGPAGAAPAGRGPEAGRALAHEPRSRPRAKKRRRDRLVRLARGRPGWAFGLADEVWFSRLAQPALHAWTSGRPLRLGMHAAGRDDPGPKALACHGPWPPERERMLPRFVAGRPVSAVTCPFLAWAAGRLAAEGVRVPALVWDDAPWHVSRAVRAWIAAHDRRVEAAGSGCRLLVCRPPSRSPWLDPIEPGWVHGKRAVAEPERKLAAAELQRRLCDHYRCPLVEPLAQQAA